MLIHQDFSEIVNRKKLADHDFLALHIWQIMNYPPDEMAVIKNQRCEFLAITDKMASEFNLSADILGQAFTAVAAIPLEVSTEVVRQELQLIEHVSRQMSFYFYRNPHGVTKSYMVRKRALVNPDSGNVVGILVNTEPASPNIMRKFLISQDKLPRRARASESGNLTQLQIQIILCLLTGINSRKEIAQLLSRLTASDISDVKIKNSLQLLYKEFNCSNVQQLTDFLLSNPSMYDFTEYPISPGNYLLEH